EHQVHERNTEGTAETNNAATTTQTATVAPYPDLKAENLRVEPAAGLQSGTVLVVFWDDTNTGDRATVGSWVDTLVIQNTTTGETFTTLTLAYDETAAGNGPIAPGQSRPRQLAYRLPDGVRGAGSIEFRVATDASNQV